MTAETEFEFPADPGALLSQEAVRAAIGGISRMGLNRWIRRGLFPPPRKILRKNYWTAAQVAAFRARVAAGETAEPGPLPVRKGKAKRPARPAARSRRKARKAPGKKPARRRS